MSSADSPWIPRLHHLVPATAARMGNGVPEGWAQPSRWPGRSYADLQPAVLRLYGGVCQLCREPGDRCARVDGKGPRALENLVLLCRTCLGLRPYWTADDIHRLTLAARLRGLVLRRMTGYGLPRLAPSPPEAVPSSTPGKPEPRTVRVQFMITPSERDRITNGDLSFKLNPHARNRLLGRRNVTAHLKVKANWAGVLVKQAARSLRTAVASQTGAGESHVGPEAVLTQCKHLDEAVILLLELCEAL